MAFNSFFFFFLFLPITVMGYFLVGRRGSRIWPKIWLLTASLLFYSAGRIEDLWILAASVAVNGLLAPRLAERVGYRRLSSHALLVIGISANVLLLCWFKYAGFFIETYNFLFGASLAVPHPVFPLGISFCTVQQIMYLVDSYEGLIDEHDWLDYFLFSGLFCYVTMGPIVRWKQLVPQVNDPNSWHFNPDNVATGLYIFLIGLFKKVVLADTFFRWADAGFSYNHSLSLVGSWIAAVSFAFQLYFDFSGYTDMAIGGALMFNINLPQNFDEPFRAVSIADFWRRWHMTLTSFITTYLYTPILRSMAQVTFSRAMLATFLAMVIAGFWHGANWTFIIFGALHGAALVVAQCWKKTRIPMPDSIGWVLTFTFVVGTLVFFRSANVMQAAGILKSMFTLQGGIFSYEPWMGIDRVDHIMGILWMLCGAAFLLRGHNSLELQRGFKPSWATVAVSVALAGISCIYANGVVSRSFVYRDF